MSPALSPDLQDRFMAVPGGRIHYLERGRARSGALSTVVCPGNWEPAWRAAPLLEGLPGHGLAITYRGHGRSFTPDAGYDLAHHVDDLHRMILDSGAGDLCLVGFSRGVGYALGYLAAHPRRVRGLVLMDAPPVHGRPGEGYAEYWREKTYRGYRIRDHWRPRAIEAMAREATEVRFPEVLPDLDLPVLVLRGTAPASPVPSNLADEDIEAYRAWLPQVRVTACGQAGHMLLDEAPEACLDAVRAFQAALTGGKELTGPGSPLRR
jgi:pimeloyl-ACP methyl ester carboxylesterase